MPAIRFEVDLFINQDTTHDFAQFRFIFSPEEKLPVSTEGDHLVALEGDGFKHMYAINRLAENVAGIKSEYEGGNAKVRHSDTVLAINLNPRDAEINKIPVGEMKEWGKLEKNYLDNCLEVMIGKNLLTPEMKNDVLATFNAGAEAFLERANKIVQAKDVSQTASLMAQGSRSSQSKLSVLPRAVAANITTLFGSTSHANVESKIIEENKKYKK